MRNSVIPPSGCKRSYIATLKPILSFQPNERHVFLSCLSLQYNLSVCITFKCNHFDMTFCLCGLKLFALITQELSKAVLSNKRTIFNVVSAVCEESATPTSTSMCDTSSGTVRWSHAHTEAVLTQCSKGQPAAFVSPYWNTTRKYKKYVCSI